MKKKNSKKKECTRVVYGGPMQVTRDRKYTDEEREDAMYSLTYQMLSDQTAPDLKFIAVNDSTVNHFTLQDGVEGKKFILIEQNNSIWDDRRMLGQDWTCIAISPLVADAIWTGKFDSKEEAFSQMLNRSLEIFLASYNAGREDGMKVQNLKNDCQEYQALKYLIPVLDIRCDSRVLYLKYEDDLDILDYFDEKCAR